MLSTQARQLRLFRQRYQQIGQGKGVGIMLKKCILVYTHTKLKKSYTQRKTLVSSKSSLDNFVRPPYLIQNDVN